MSQGTAIPAAVPVIDSQTGNPKFSKPSKPVIPPSHTALNVKWLNNAHRPPVVAASYDGWLHHRMVEASASEGVGYHLTLPVPLGVAVSYKFLVDGVWRVDESAASGHTISSDGKVHNVPPVFDDKAGQSNAARGSAGKENNSSNSKAVAANFDAGDSGNKPVPCTSKLVAITKPLEPNATRPLEPCRDESTIPELLRGTSFSDGFGIAQTSRTLQHHGDDETLSENDWRHNFRFGNRTSGLASAARRSVLIRMKTSRWKARFGSEVLRSSYGHTEGSTMSDLNDWDSEKSYRETAGDPDNLSNPGQSVASSCGMISASASAPVLGPASTRVPAKPSQEDHVVDGVSDCGRVDCENSMNTTNVDIDKLTRAPQTVSDTGSLKRKLGSSRGVKNRFSAFEELGLRSRNAQPSSVLSPSSARVLPPSFVADSDVHGPPCNTMQGVRMRENFGGGHQKPHGMGGLRSSSKKLQKVVISGPTRVDEPVDSEHVHRTAQNWRDMARHLQDDLKDPVGARQLLNNAIEHREKHGLWSTFENAQAHIDLARSLSKSSNLSDTEFHLRIALRIYDQVHAAAEHQADLIHYIAVVVDRQKRRTDAEVLYRKALCMYKSNKLTGDNVQIALKNLSLNLRKQNRSVDAENVSRDYYVSVEYANGNEAQPS